MGFNSIEDEEIDSQLVASRLVASRLKELSDNQLRFFVELFNGNVDDYHVPMLFHECPSCNFRCCCDSNPCACECVNEELGDEL